MTVRMFLACWLFLVIFQENETRAENANSSLAYFGEDAYVTYETWSIPGKMAFIFKTRHQRGLLAYQDDGEYDYLELVLNSKGLQMELTVGRCRRSKVLIEGTFADSKWHRVVLEGNLENLNLAVDGCFTKTIRCIQELPFSPVKRLYVRAFPPSLRTETLMSPNAYYYEKDRRFIGCLGRFQYSDADEKFREVELRERSGITREHDYCLETGLEETSGCSQGLQPGTTPIGKRRQVENVAFGLRTSLPDHITMTTASSSNSEKRANETVFSQVLDSSTSDKTETLSQNTARGAATVTKQLSSRTVVVVSSYSTTCQSTPVDKTSEISSSVHRVNGVDILSATIGSTSPLSITETVSATPQRTRKPVPLALALMLNKTSQTTKPVPYSLFFRNNTYLPIISHHKHLTPRASNVEGSYGTIRNGPFLETSFSVSVDKGPGSSSTLGQIPGPTNKIIVLAQRNRAPRSHMFNKFQVSILYLLIMVCH